MTIMMREIVLYILVKDKKILLEKRKASERYPGMWALPTGHVEMEDKVSTLIREIKEETGLSPEQYVLLESIRYESGDDKSLLHVFLITKFSGKEKPETDEGRELGWFSFEEARNRLSTDTDFHRTAREILEKAEKSIRQA